MIKKIILISIVTLACLVYTIHSCVACGIPTYQPQYQAPTCSSGCGHQGYSCGSYGCYRQRARAAVSFQPEGGSRSRQHPMLRTLEDQKIRHSQLLDAKRRQLHGENVELPSSEEHETRPMSALEQVAPSVARLQSARSLNAPVNPNAAFMECCMDRKLPDACLQKCNFGVYTKDVLTKMYFKQDPCPIAAMSEIQFCAAQGRDHKACCYRNGVTTTLAGDKCLLFCDQRPGKVTPLDMSYVSCFDRFENMKACFWHDLSRFTKIMLAETNFENLIKQTATQKALCGSFFPINNNVGMTDFELIYGVVVNENDINGTLKPIAFACCIQYSNKSYYTMMNVMDAKYDNKFVTVKEDLRFKKELASSTFSVMTIDKVVDVQEDFSGLAPYYVNFGERKYLPLSEVMMNQLIINTKTEKNFNLAINMTIDLVCSNDGYTPANGLKMQLLNSIGYVTCDSQYFQECTHNIHSLKHCFSENETLKHNNFVPLSEKNSFLLLEYDATLCWINRTDYLRHLFKLGNVKGTMLLDEDMNKAVGYIISINNHILGCYGEDEDIQKDLIKKHLDQLDNDEEITFYIKGGEEDPFTAEILNNSLEIKEVRRLHTRIPIRDIAWSKMMFLNIGCFIY
uniref:DB domain-containing protein n=1 Tax=Rhabditophanes sp. KR3021 TaxID=114890 RepID=A0AC35U407_9BILA